jgi:hypothetical protein
MKEIEREYVYVCTHIHFIHIHSYTRKVDVCLHIHMYMYTFTHMHAENVLPRGHWCTHRRVHACATCIMHACVHGTNKSHVYVYTHTHIHIHSQKNTRARHGGMHSCVHGTDLKTHACTHTHTHTHRGRTPRRRRAHRSGRTNHAPRPQAWRPLPKQTAPPSQCPHTPAP